MGLDLKMIPNISKQIPAYSNILPNISKVVQADYYPIMHCGQFENTYRPTMHGLGL